MPPGSRLLVPELKLKVATSSGVCVFFNTKEMEHGTEECEPSGPGEAARMGIALHCRRDVSGCSLDSKAHSLHELDESIVSR